MKTLLLALGLISISTNAQIMHGDYQGIDREGNACSVTIKRLTANKVSAEMNFTAGEENTFDDYIQVNEDSGIKGLDLKKKGIILEPYDTPRQTLYELESSNTAVYVMASGLILPNFAGGPLKRGKVVKLNYRNKDGGLNFLHYRQRFGRGLPLRKFYQRSIVCYTTPEISTVEDIQRYEQESILQRRREKYEYCRDLDAQGINDWNNCGMNWDQI